MPENENECAHGKIDKETSFIEAYWLMQFSI